MAAFLPELNKMATPAYVEAPIYSKPRDAITLNLPGANEAGVIYNQGTDLLLKNKYKKALVKLLASAKIFPSREVYTNMGNCYRALDQDKKMFECYSRALEKDLPSLGNNHTRLHAMNNLGLAHFMYGEDDRAIEIYTRAITEKEDFWECWWNCSTATLRKASTSGDPELFARGWQMYDSRFMKTPPVTLKNTKENLNYWEPGKRVKSIIVLAEQGIGDNIMFGRYVKHLREYADRVYVQCDPSLKSVFEPEFECTVDAAFVDVDAAYPMCSLAGALPEVGIPAGDWLKDKYATRDFEITSKPNVGIVWSGSPTHANDRHRSVNIHRFHRLSRIANLYSLSPGFKGDKHVKSLGIKSWEDTAAAIKGLDLTIGVDTSVMHMVGSLGCPGWLIQPYKETDFRWGIVHTGAISTKSVWYDSIRVFDNMQDWDRVFANVEAELEKFALIRTKILEEVDAELASEKDKNEIN